MSAEEKEGKLEKDRKEQCELWAYLIMHNMGMKNKEKRK